MPNAKTAQHRALPNAASCCVDVGTGKSRQLQRCEADAAGRSVNQHPAAFALLWVFNSQGKA